MKLFVTPLSRLDETLRLSGARRLITLLSQDAAYGRPNGIPEEAWLRLTFHDIGEAREGLTAPSAAHLRSILDFAAASDRRAPLVIHCHAGISRSTAAAYAVACALQPARDEGDIAKELRRLAPSATPNPLIVAHSDAELGRSGRMVGAIRRIGRGADAFEGAPFCLDV